MKPTTGQGINPGAMRDQVQIQQRTTTQGAAGELLPSWTTFATRRAEVVRLPGREIWASVERNGRVPTTFKLRWLDGVLPQMRLLCNGKVYDILSAIDPTGRHEELMLACHELVEEVPPQ